MSFAPPENVAFDQLHKPNTYMGLTDEYYVVFEDGVYELRCETVPFVQQPLQSITFSQVVQEAFDFINEWAQK